MRRPPILPTLLLALMATAAAGPGPLTGQVPDNVPDLPGESPADRAKARLIESHRGFLSRLFSSASFDAAPLPRGIAGYQTNVALGLDFRNGDAVFLAMSGRMLPLEADPLERTEDPWLWYAGAGYTLNGARVLGTSEAARRTALTAELGVWTGEAALVALDLIPTYEILRGHSWSVPVGLRLSLARVAGPDHAFLHPFVGLSVATKFHFFTRERLELK